MPRGCVIGVVLLVLGCGETVSVGSQAPTYHDAIAPMLAAQCVGCHGPDDAVPLHDYASASERRLAALSVMLDGSMPPWGDPDPRCLELTGIATPTGADVIRFRAWALAGAPEGEPRPAPDVTGWDAPVVRADLRAEAEPFTPPGHVHTQCFVLEAIPDTDTRVTAARLITSNPDQILFAELLDTVLAPEVLAEVLDQDPDPGWACPWPDPYRTLERIALWPGGEASVRHPEGTGTRLVAGRRLILRVRYAETEPLTDVAGVELELDPSARAARIVGHEPAEGSRLEVEGGVADATFVAAVFATSTAPRTVHAIAPGLPGGRRGRDRLARFGDGDTCFVDAARGARRTWFSFAQPFRIESTELLEITCTYDTREDTRALGIGVNDARVPCGAHLYVTSWMPTDG